MKDRKVGTHEVKIMEGLLSLPQAVTDQGCETSSEPSNLGVRNLLLERQA